MKSMSFGELGHKWFSWWLHHDVMEKLSALLPPVTGGFPHNVPVTLGISDVSLNKLLS